MGEPAAEISPVPGVGIRPGRRPIRVCRPTPGTRPSTRERAGWTAPQPSLGWAPVAEYSRPAMPLVPGLALPPGPPDDSSVVASGSDRVRSLPPCPQCGGKFKIKKAESSRYLLCRACGLVRMLPFAALNPGSSLLDALQHPTAV